ncbi:Geranylgeranyl transferase type-2 subunit beta 1 [Porphyridium purpureum]|uniref:Geranylgeranyl transferase type-2 subunit beta n=1 Tax=Porphyridium purpureum TaxID=35688 RepID=A0A5J4Z241_PORPP|nr:Geranylgeranyl transferase type-2 subunit beta 1 [Porphyridium purpureum]|eukprot:POR0278..scf208_2
MMTSDNKSHRSMDESVCAQLLAELHVESLLRLEASSESYLQFLLEHKKMSAMYWALTSLALLRSLHTLADRGAVLAFIKGCERETTSAGEDKTNRSQIAPALGYAGNVDQDAHLLYTLSAVQCLAVLGEFVLIEAQADRIAAYVRSLQNADGSFCGDAYGEVDTRFSYAALLTLQLIRRTDAVDVEAAVNYVLSCRNFDGGFGCIPFAESHAGQVFCCVGALKLAGALDRVDQTTLGWWLCQRQLPNGGLNGRPDKKEDVCYSWWVLSSLSMLDKQHWIDANALGAFIMRAQDDEYGGIADRPGDRADVFHTFFGLAGLSLLGHPSLEHIHPMYALPCSVIRQLNFSESA